jgi:hypothetical protein
MAKTPKETRKPTGGVYQPARKPMPSLEKMTPAQRLQFMHGYIRGHVLARGGNGKN